MVCLQQFCMAGHSSSASKDKDRTGGADYTVNHTTDD